MVLISESKEGLQRQIDALKNYCDEWKLKINIKKTKSMIFNRGNKLINTNFNVGGTPIENVKDFSYLGFKISAKNCNFNTTIEDLSIKANRAIFAIQNKAKFSKIPTEIALKIFNAQIVPILLYGSEVWGPYTNFDFHSWDKAKIEQIQTQFLKRTLGCGVATTNIMIRAKTGIRPLLNQIIKRYISYLQSLRKNTSSLAYSALTYETENHDPDNNNDTFFNFLEKFNLDPNLVNESKSKIKKTCNDAYDRIWKNEINNPNSKAISYCKYKTTISLEPYLSLNFNRKNRIAISRFRLSNHSLMIEKGRHVKPIKITRNERFCNFCTNEVEDEKHFLMLCPNMQRHGKYSKMCAFQTVLYTHS